MKKMDEQPNKILLDMHYWKISKAEEAEIEQDIMHWM